jgi:hypothetical protein
MNRILPRLALIIFALAPVAFAATPQTFLTLNSQPGDYIGQGQQYTFTPSDGTFTFQMINGTIQVFFDGADGNSWTLFFEPPVGATLTRGIYEYAQRFNSTLPGLSVGGDGRGCNTDTGRFLVSNVSISANGEVENFAVDFEQHCEEATPALYGSLRYNSTVAAVPRISVANANVLKGNAGTNAGNAIVSLCMPSNETITVDFATADDTAIQGEDYVSTTETVQFQPGVTAQTVAIPILGNPLPRGNLSFRLHLSEASGAPLAASEASMKFWDPNVNMTALIISSEPGDFIGLGRNYVLTLADGTFVPSINYDNGISLIVENLDDWTLDFAAPNDATLTAGTYPNAQRFPFQPLNTPGLSVDGNGGGCNTLTGGFVVHDVETDSGTVQHFSADLEQHCEGETAALFGWVRINAPLQQISISDAVIDIGTSTAVFTVALHPAAQAPVSVQFATADGTALAGVDYKSVSKTINFAPGTTSVTVSVPVRVNTDSGKIFYGQLSAPTSLALWISQGVATF